MELSRHWLQYLTRRIGYCFFPTHNACFASLSSSSLPFSFFLPFPLLRKYSTIVSPLCVLLQALVGSNISHTTTARNCCQSFFLQWPCYWALRISPLKCSLHICVCDFLCFFFASRSGVAARSGEENGRPICIGSAPPIEFTPSLCILTLLNLRKKSSDYQTKASKKEGRSLVEAKKRAGGETSFQGKSSSAARSASSHSLRPSLSLALCSPLRDLHCPCIVQPSWGRRPSLSLLPLGDLSTPRL